MLWFRSKLEGPVVFNREDTMSAAEVTAQREKDVLEDINQMDGIISGAIPDPSLTAPAEPEEPVEPAEPTEPDGTGEVVVATGEPEEPVAEPTAPVAPVTPVAAVAEPVATDPDEYGLADFINSMSRDALGKKPTPQPEPVAAPAQAQVQAPVQPAQTQARPQVEVPVDLISAEDMTEAFQSPEKMIELITKVYAKAVSDATQLALTRLPNVIQPVVAQQADLISMARNLYEQNPELNDYRDFVQYCAVKVEDKHPEWSAKQVMEEAVKEAKTRLPQLKAAVTRTKREASSPAFVGNQSQKGKNSPSPGRMSALDKELAAMPERF